MKNPILLLAILASASLFAQSDFEEYKRKEEERFRKYVAKEDSAFADFVRKAWEEQQVMAAEERSGKVPKPIEIPVAKYDPNAPHSNFPLASRAPLPKPNLPDRPKIGEIKTPTSGNYHSKIGMMSYPFRIQTEPKFKGIRENEIAEVWSDLLKWEKENQISSQIAAHVRANKLNDWATLQIIRNLSKQLTQNPSYATILDVMIARQMGLDVRMARVENELVLLSAVEQTVYGVDYVTIGGIKYYLIQKNTPRGQVYTYGANEQPLRPLNLRISRDMKFDSKLKTRNFSVPWRGKNFPFSVSYPEDQVKFLDETPGTDLEWYFATDLPEVTWANLDAQLGSILDTMNKSDQLAFILNFVQLGFKYETDQDQFGREKYFYPVEVFIYPYADCEDRSILFSALVRRYLHLQVIGLDYPGHVCTAVASEEYGDYVVLNNKRYLICDPTYMHAPPGLCMPDFLDEAATPISIPE